MTSHLCCLFRGSPIPVTHRTSSAATSELSRYFGALNPRLTPWFSLDAQASSPSGLPLASDSECLSSPCISEHRPAWRILNCTLCISSFARINPPRGHSSLPIHLAVRALVSTLLEVCTHCAPTQHSGSPTVLRLPRITFRQLSGAARRSRASERRPGAR